jgi:hypothetical protein
MPDTESHEPTVAELAETIEAVAVRLADMATRVDQIGREVVRLGAILAVDPTGRSSERLTALERRLEAWAGQTTYLVEHYVGGEPGPDLHAVDDDEDE